VTAPIVELQHLSKRYGRLTALDDVSLTVERGEIFALLGPNGAGKTTLIGIVSGLVAPSAGTARVDGHDVVREYQRTRRDVGLVPQEVNFDPFFTVEELLRFQAGYFGVRLGEAKIVEVLSALGLLEKRRANTRTLSGGMKRRLLIAKALVHEPKVLFLDEPTAGVDVELRRDLLNYVRTLRARGTTIVLTTHYIEEAELLADRVGVIDRGRLKLVEAKDKLMQRMGSRTLVMQLARRVEVLPAALGALGAVLGENGASIVFTGPAMADLGPKVRAVTEAGLEVRDLDVRETKLEEVFIRLLREAA
jgi:ABC-2 type transport system ATP-binding protein